MDWVLKLGFGDQTQGEDWYEMSGNRLKGLESGATATEGVCRGSPAHLRGQVPLFGGCMRAVGRPAIAAFSLACTLRWQDTTYTKYRSDR